MLQAQKKYKNTPSAVRTSGEVQVRRFRLSNPSESGIKYPRISMQREKEPGHGAIKDFRIAFADCWQRLPNKAFFFILLAAWLVLFQFLGNATLGYIHSQNPSLFRWMLDAYDPEGKYLRSDDGHGVFIPFVVLALFWWKRKELMAQPLRTWPPGLGIVVLAAFFTARIPELPLRKTNS